MARFFNSCWHHCATITSTIFQQSLARLFNSGWHGCSSIVTGMIVQQSLAQLFNSHWHNRSTVTSKNSKLSGFFKSGVHCWRIVPCTSNTTHAVLERYVLVVLVYKKMKRIILLSHCFLQIYSRMPWSTSWLWRVHITSKIVLIWQNFIKRERNWL